MKKIHITLLATLIFQLNSISQIVFEDGYFIDDSGNYIDCLIKNIDWNNNPTGFEYKLYENSEVQYVSIGQAREFGVKGMSKYVRATVNIDRSSNVTTMLGKERSPDFQKEQLYLNTLIEGKASLYIYKEGSLVRFFLTNDTIQFQQLIYKRYLIGEDQIGTNVLFRHQLYNYLSCPEITLNETNKLNYIKRDLKKIVIKYNQHQKTDYINYSQKENRENIYKLRIRPGLNYSSLNIFNEYMNFGRIVYPSQYSFRFGLENEFVLPFNKNKWSLLFEPAFQSFNTEYSAESNNISGGMLISQVDHKSIELPLGIRYYSFFNENSKVFINASYFFDLTFSSNILILRSDGSIYNEFDIKPDANLAFGIGYCYKDRYSIELKYLKTRGLLGIYQFWTSDYTTFSMVAGIKIF